MPRIIEGSLKKKRLHKNVAVLLDENTILLEDCGTTNYEGCPDRTKIYATKQTINHIYRDRRIGEIQRRNSTMVRWRKECPYGPAKKGIWRNHKLDVNVVNISCDKPSELLEALMFFRDFIEWSGGSMGGTIANAARTFFNAIEPDFEPPFNRWDLPIERIVGGRVLQAKSLRTRFYGQFFQWDLQSAYPRQLSEMRYGGRGSRWSLLDNCDYDKFIEKGHLVYVEATVEIPEMKYGPLPDRSIRSRKSFFIPEIQYPVGQLLTGIWTHEEVKMAEDIGCRVTRHKHWVHLATGKEYYFKDYYESFNTVANHSNGATRSLFKIARNSLWGQFCSRPSVARTFSWTDNSSGKRKKERIDTPPFPLSRKKVAMDLGDQLCGKVRHDLLEMAISAGDDLIQANTDGAWVGYREGWRPPNDNWIIKNEADSLRIATDTVYEFHNEFGWHLVFPGVEAYLSREQFERMMAKEKLYAAA